MHSTNLNVARRRACAIGARCLLIAGFAAALAGCATQPPRKTPPAAFQVPTVIAIRSP